MSTSVVQTEKRKTAVLETKPRKVRGELGSCVYTVPSESFYFSCQVQKTFRSEIQK